MMRHVLKMPIRQECWMESKPLPVIRAMSMFWMDGLNNLAETLMSLSMMEDIIIAKFARVT
jgi:hypothetical protein